MSIVISQIIWILCSYLAKTGFIIGKNINRLCDSIIYWNYQLASWVFCKKNLLLPNTRGFLVPTNTFNELLTTFLNDCLFLFNMATKGDRVVRF